MGEKVCIVGYRDLKFTDDNGREIAGRSYYFTQTSDGVVGVLAGKMFVSSRALSEMKYLPVVGDDVIVFYNRYGKPCGFQQIK